MSKRVFCFSMACVIGALISTIVGWLIPSVVVGALAPALMLIVLVVMAAQLFKK